MKNVEEINKVVQSYLAGQDDIESAYIFGSFARGGARKDSDVDIAVLFTAAGADKMARFERRLELEMELEGLLKRPVQVVDLEAATPLLQHQVRKYGRLVLDRNKKRRVDYEVQARRKYLDMQKFLRVRQEAMLKRLGE